MGNRYGFIYIPRFVYNDLISEGIKKKKKKPQHLRNALIEMSPDLIWFGLDLIYPASTTLTYCTAHDKREMGWLTDLTAYLFTFCYTFCLLFLLLLFLFLISRQILFWVSFSLSCAFLFLFPRYLIFLVKSIWLIWLIHVDVDFDVIYSIYAMNDDLFFEHILHILSSVYGNRKGDG